MNDIYEFGVFMVIDDNNIIYNGLDIRSNLDFTSDGYLTAGFSADINKNLKNNNWILNNNVVAGNVLVYNQNSFSWAMPNQEKLHREDGPAYTKYFEDGTKIEEYWLNGEQIFVSSQEEFEKIVKTRIIE